MLTLKTSEKMNRVKRDDVVIKTNKDGGSSRKEAKKVSQDAAAWLPVTLRSIEKSGEMG